MIRSLWQEYCMKSSIHGLRYVVDSKRPHVERVVWGFLLVTAAVWILYQVWESWLAFSTGPTQIFVDNPRYPLSNIDFPAVTICPINKVMYSKVQKQMDAMFNESDVESRQSFLHSMLAMSMMRYPYYDNSDIFLQNKTAYPLDNHNIDKIMVEVGPTLDEVFNRCFWRGTEHDCKDLIRPQRTEEGFCFSFNSKTAERDYNTSDINPPVPGKNGSLHALRNNAAGKITGFEVLLKSMEHEYLPSDERVRGYNVIIHSPEDFPDVSSNFVVFKDVQKVTRITVLASVVVGDKSLLRLNEEVRGCYFIHEYNLPTDTPSFVGNGENNCYSRCRLNAIYKHCNCTPYFFPPIKPGLAQCGIQHLKCLRDINVLQRNSMAPSGEPGFPHWSLPVYMDCFCKQPCSFTTYTTEIRHTYADFYQSSDYYVYFEVQYKELYAISYTRFLKLDVRDLMVSFGGVASLFLGCSLISVAEVLYFVARSIKRIIKYRNRNFEETHPEKAVHSAEKNESRRKMNFKMRWFDKSQRFKSLVTRKNEIKPIQEDSKSCQDKFYPYPYYP